MVATDTVVGIVGAVLLVAVMAGVFAYEYNNPVEAEATSDAGQRAHFEEDYAGMSATDDIDGDGQANYLDDDVDGDGTANENDTSVATTSESTGAIGPSGGPVSTSFSQEVIVGNGSVHVTATVTLTTAVPMYSGNFAIQLVDPDGTIVDTAASAASGSGSLTVETGDDTEMKAGTWTVRVTNNQAGLGGSAHIVAEVHYPDIAMGHGHTPEKR
ncbi:MAG: hypothetical protein QOC71_1026 [Thermoplasmata archaeon]|jgi:hypothetical protein|nr:hypothetical protein [Thermoplasmata archaeon]